MFSICSHPICRACLHRASMYLLTEPSYLWDGGYTRSSFMSHKGNHEPKLMGGKASLLCSAHVLTRSGEVRPYGKSGWKLALKRDPESVCGARHMHSGWKPWVDRLSIPPSLYSSSCRPAMPSTERPLAVNSQVFVSCSRQHHSDAEPTCSGDMRSVWIILLLGLNKKQNKCILIKYQL